MPNQKKLYRNTDNKVIAGIVSGLADYFDMDVIFLRIIAVVLLVITGFFPFGLVYIIAIFIIPEKPSASK